MEHFFAIVDWGGAISGDPLVEFACFVAGSPADDIRPGLILPGVKQAYAKYAGRKIESQEGKACILYTMLNTLMNARWCLQEMPSWIDDLFGRAISLNTQLRRL